MKSVLVFANFDYQRPIGRVEIDDDMAAMLCNQQLVLSPGIRDGELVGFGVIPAERSIERQ